MRVKLKLAVAVGCSLMVTSASWGALTQIYVTANNGVGGLTSTAYDTVYGGASSGWAGNWNAKITGGFIPTGAPALNTTWQSYCMDIGNAMGSGGTYNYTADAFANGNPPANNPPDPRWVAGGGSKAGYLYAAHLGDVTDVITRSALCIAIWEVLYESGTYDVSTYNTTKGFKVVANGSGNSVDDANSLAAIAKANSWLTSAMTDGFNNAPATTWWKESAGNDPQSLIGVPSMVPEPTTFVAGGLLLLPFLASTIRRKLKAS